MASVSQNGRRKLRPWTAQDQIVAEVAAACGVGYAEIGRALRRSDSLVRKYLVAAVAEKKRLCDQRWQEANFERKRETNCRWRQRNIERVREHRRLSYQANIDIELRRSSEWGKANPERKRVSSRRWRTANPDAFRRSNMLWRQKNIEKQKQRISKYRAENATRIRENNRRRRAWKTAARRAALQPLTRQQIDARFALWGNHCAFCAVDASDSRNHGHERLTVEHVLALTKGGLDEASNIIPACTACNSSKHNSPVEDWYRQQPWFTEARWRKIQRHCPAAVVGQLPLALAA